MIHSASMVLRADWSGVDWRKGGEEVRTGVEVYCLIPEMVHTASDTARAVDNTSEIAEMHTIKIESAI